MKFYMMPLIWGLSCISLQAQTVDICKEIQRTFPLPAYSSPQADLSKPFNFNEHSVSPNTRKILESICFRFEENGEIHGVDNKPITKAQYFSLMDPFNTQTHPLSTDVKGSLYSNTCRYDTGPYITCKDDGEDLQYTLNNLMMLQIEINLFLSRQLGLIDRVKPLISNIDPKKPLDEGTKDKIKKTVKNIGIDDQNHIPLELRSALAGGQIKGLKGSLDETSRQLNKLFDNASSQQDLKKALESVNIHTGEWGRKGDYSYFDGNERQIGMAIQNQVAETLSGNPVGREILNHLR
jgi:hypothetical protein